VYSNIITDEEVKLALASFDVVHIIIWKGQGENEKIIIIIVIVIVII